ncbi:MAG: FkbM family methyltransferase [Acidobacteria bacterium]|nr:FkbM family methyltransferase [Acidobacteriota bacterium]MBI3425581.1 FkbM family methyltransferase [Acidobacteriota bacterium]
MKLSLYNLLLRVRPAQLGAFLKTLLMIRRIPIKTNLGHIYWADPVSVFGNELLAKSVYEQQMTNLLTGLLRPGDNFFDIGGNEGYFSILAATLVGAGKVFCIEPQTRLQHVLKKNIELNAVTNISVHPIALGSRKGEAQLFLRPSTNTGASSLSRHWKLGSKRETVAMQTLDDLFQQHKINKVRLLKMDCEGAELQIVEGAQQTLQRQVIEYIALEYHPTIIGQEACSHIDKQIRQAGYCLSMLNGQHVYHLAGRESELQMLGHLEVSCQ